jgi:CubicO group peptidase (beta-lactamase class C family)
VTGSCGIPKLVAMGGVLALTWCASATGVAEPGFDRLDGKRRTQVDIDGGVDRLMRAAGIPGLALALIEHGRVVYAKAYGQRDTEGKLPLTTDTIMSGASLTKSAFAYMCMELVQEGKLMLDKPIGEYLKRPLPEYRGYGDLADDARWQKFTARMLLSHTSGLPNLRQSIYLANCSQMTGF